MNSRNIMDSLEKNYLDLERLILLCLNIQVVRVGDDKI